MEIFITIHKSLKRYHDKFEGMTDSKGLKLSATNSSNKLCKIHKLD